ncbi:MAG: hypothetical protein JNL10_04785 [Verrucomicrobiales bacterium]|nr:hypothetical protein [Verrucomicrobiales bacterium]
MRYLLRLGLAGLWIASRSWAAEPVAYEIGDPTDLEQMYLELMNRSRANPTAEGVRLAETKDLSIQAAVKYFSVDLQKLKQDFAAIPAAPPLAFEPRLISAARGHSAWMKEKGIQDHTEFDPATGQVLNLPNQRVKATGYSYRYFAESIFARATSVEYGHAGFLVDWGPGPGGVLNPPGHRISNFSPLYREVGIGVLEGLGPNETGPQFVTIDFGARPNPDPLVTGVVHYDFDGDGFYDPGEGVGGIQARLESGNAVARSAGSGGYALPSTDGSHQVTFSWNARPLNTVPVTVTGGNNVKVDLRLSYVAPTLSGTLSPSLGRANAYAISEVPGALSYQWRTQSIRSLPSFTAESNLAGVVLEAPGTPFPIIPANGGHVYHLTHSQSLLPQYLTLNAWVRPGADGAIRFLHRMGIAGDGEIASLQVSEEDGAWETLWSVRGFGSPGKKVFTTETVPLGNRAGRILKFRFAYVFAGGTYYSQPNPEVGIQLDDIQFSGADEVVPGASHDVAAGQAVAFTPEALQGYQLAVRPVRSGGFWPWGPGLDVTAVVGPPPAPEVTEVVPGPNGNLRIDFTLPGALPGIPVLQRSPGLGGAFAPVVATLRTNSPGNFSFQYVPEGTSGFLRVATP